MHQISLGLFTMRVSTFQWKNCGDVFWWFGKRKEKKLKRNKEKKKTSLEIKITTNRKFNTNGVNVK